MFDYESEKQIHVKQFKTTLDRMKEAQSIRVGKDITYRLGYRNFTFELWIVLHKNNASAVLIHRRQYLTLINKAYGESFKNLIQYKREDNFKRVLSKLTLNDVREAIGRAKAIMRKKRDQGFVLQQYKGYRYYRENPSLSL